MLMLRKLHVFRTQTMEHALLTDFDLAITNLGSKG